MKKIVCAVLMALSLAAVPGLFAQADKSPVEFSKSLQPLSKGLVRVEYYLQYDKADAPAGGLGNERCPNCGSFHGNELRKYLEEDRPVEVVGFLVAPDRVVTADPQIHSRFV